MDTKTLHTLEYSKVLEILASYTGFSVAGERARSLAPSTDLNEVERWLKTTGEARALLKSNDDLSVGGARDIRTQADTAMRGGVLLPVDFLDIKSTLIAARTMTRLFDTNLAQFPLLAEIASSLPQPLGLIDSISRTVSERGEVLDSASDKLAQIRSDLGIAHDRLLSRLQRMLNNPKITPFLQETIITQRDNRYVVPVKAEAKGRVKGVVHDRSASGATVFIEPMAIVELNNKYRELQMAQRDEERRVLADLSQSVGGHAAELIQAVETLAELDLLFAKAKYANAIDGVAPELKPFSSSKKAQGSGVDIRLLGARHPLLEEEIVVPIDVKLDPHVFSLVITGPNTGGKTVTLKTIGLLALMAQTGLHIPVEKGSTLNVFSGVYADIGDEQSIEQSLSTFSAHVTNIIEIMDKADSKSLVLLDELGAGTDPQEGSALARALLTFFLERGIPTFVATHYPELKAFAHGTPGVMNASVEFNIETLQPTYHLTLGLPGRSNALAIASRLGLSDDIVRTAREEIDPADLRAEDLLEEIHRQRDLTREARTAADQARKDVESLRGELSDRLERIEDERREILEAARKQAAVEINDLQNELNSVRQALLRARQPLDALEVIEEEVDELSESVDVPVERRKADLIPRDTIQLGSKVLVRTLDSVGIVTAIGETEAEVQVGNLRVRANIDELESPGRDKEREHLEDSVIKTGDQPRVGIERPQSPGVELSLRGYRVDDALDVLDRYIDTAYMAGLPYVRIIHGKGTGRLRDAVRQALLEHPNVDSYESGGPREGGDGVTIAKFS